MICHLKSGLPERGLLEPPLVLSRSVSVFRGKVWKGHLGESVEVKYSDCTLKRPYLAASFSLINLNLLLTEINDKKFDLTFPT